MTVFSPLTHCGFSATHLKGLKSKYQDLFNACQLWQQLTQALHIERYVNRATIAF